MYFITVLERSEGLQIESFEYNLQDNMRLISLSKIKYSEKCVVCRDEEVM